MTNVTINTTIKHLMFLSLTTPLFLGCVKQDTVSKIQTMETIKVVSEVFKEKKPKTPNSQNLKPSSAYGEHTDEIEKFLSSTPLGSEIYLEQKENGEWYLKVEKTFTAQKDEEKKEISEPLYGETILI